MRLYDCHCHISDKENYSIPYSGRNIIFNSIDEYVKRKLSLNDTESASLIFDYKNNLDFIENELISKNIAALKIHNRIQKIAEEDIDEIILVLKQIKINVPIIVDSFYYGHDLRFQPSLNHIAQIAVNFPKIKVIVAHCGGHKVLEYFYHLRSLPNIVFDLSQCLQYLRTTSEWVNLINLVRFTDKNNIMFGTDFPFADDKLQLKLVKEIFSELELSELEQNRILYENAATLFKR